MSLLRKIDTKIVTLIILILSILVLFWVFRNVEDNGREASGASQSALVGITIEGGRLEFKVYPEKRAPATGNWDTIAKLTLKDCNTGNTAYNFSDIETSAEGIGMVAEPIQAGNYQFSIIGASHLNRVFDCYNITGDALTYIDLTPENKLLLAGEVSNVYDNYVNSLDISVLVSDLYSGDYYSDLNQDTEVNSLDLSIQVYNLFKFGDT